MRTETRSAIREGRRRPGADWWNAGDCSHAVQFYSDDAVLVELLSRFVGTALVMGDAAVVLATKRHRDAVSIRLHRRGLDTAVAREQGRYVVADAAQLLEKFASQDRVSRDAFNRVVGRLLDRAARAAGGTGYRVAVFGELVALAWASGHHDTAMRIEELWNELASARKFSVCCAYPMTGFAANAHAPSFLKICAHHSHVFPAQRTPS
ncbi:MAG TPA: MEDS domain-containing protein [Vicinamibacterales bacterium]